MDTQDLQPGSPSPLVVLLNAPFTFAERPVPSPPELRPNWRTALICLLIDACWGKSASWHQVHVLNWAARSRLSRETYVRLHQSQMKPDDVVVRYDPSLDRALDLCIGELLVERSSADTFRLGERGKALIREIKRENVLIEERSFLQEVKPVSKSFIGQLIARPSA